MTAMERLRGMRLTMIQLTLWMPTQRLETNMQSETLTNTDVQKECEINVLLLERAVKAIEKLSSKLQFVVLPTGTKVCYTLVTGVC
jgi:hypothetical protein